MLQTIKTFFYFLFICLIVIFGSITAYCYLYQGNSLRIFTVASGSMEPTIKTGSLVFVFPKKYTSVIAPIPFPAYKTGDIITFDSGKETTTHRIVGIEGSDNQYLYRTKGDDNEGADVKKVAEKDILGKIFFVLPYLGYPIAFSKTQQGYIFLIIIPITIIVYSELLSLKTEVKKIIAGRKKIHNLI